MAAAELSERTRRVVHTVAALFGVAAWWLVYRSR
jgi:hypothetical protein